MQEEDTQALTQPIIAPIKPKSFAKAETQLPDTVYEKEYVPWNGSPSRFPLSAHARLSDRHPLAFT